MSKLQRFWLVFNMGLSTFALIMLFLYGRMVGDLVDTTNTSIEIEKLNTGSIEMLQKRSDFDQHWMIDMDLRFQKAFPKHKKQIKETCR